ncbi:piggyBac transposable element-derived protein 4-like [Saccostrea cucullata]|uniref:piggyBac transposable element-derived protein 4-like n=1 Tax=Saccostrea cuccullata TaxID=36930 RepID=UPI002ED42841
MGINKLPDYKLYWSKNKFLANAGFQNVMPVKWYEKLTQYLHCSSVTDDNDQLSKIRALLDMVSENINKSYSPGQYQTIDEGMIAYKGRHTAKQYIPSKPVRWGLKLWLRCDSVSGFCHQFEVYMGRACGQRQSIPLGRGVVERLTESLVGKTLHVFYDSFFTSITLAKVLLSKKIFSCGTIVRTRKDFPTDLKSLPTLKGDYLIRQDGQLTATVWMDMRPVAVLATNSSPLHESAPASRRLKDGSTVIVRRPESIANYQNYFRGVDIFDQIEVHYR